jgi:hypothetical protein
VFANFENLEGSAGSDNVVGKAIFSSFDLKAGNDTFNWYGEKTYSSVDGGAGSDTLIFGQAITVDFTKDYGTAFTGFETLYGSLSADSVKATAANFTDIDLLDGNDTFIWDGTTAIKNIDGGEDTDAIKLTTAGTFTYSTEFTNFEKLIGADEAVSMVNVTNKIGSYEFKDGNDVFIFNTAYWGTGAALDITMSYAAGHGSSLDFQNINVVAAGTGYFTFNTDGSTNPTYTANTTEAGGNLTIDFGSSGLGKLTLNGGDVNWLTSGNVIHDKNNHTMLWTGSYFKVQ